MEHTNDVAIFGGGCFWCTEAVFAELMGVTSVIPGYAGGHTENPSYQQVCSETTGHAEVSRVEFDPDRITYKVLLDVFFSTHDPTTLNRQGADQGTQYRSIILFVNDDQKQQAEDFVENLDESRTLGNPIVTEIVPLEVFFEAEPEHRQFYLENPDSTYCQIVIRPKVAKVREKFAQKIRA